VSDVSLKETDSVLKHKVLCSIFGDEDLEHVVDAGTKDYRESRRRELQGLLDTEMFAIGQQISIPEGTKIYKTR
jgi:hypothetical protein